MIAELWKQNVVNSVTPFSTEGVETCRGLLVICMQCTQLAEAPLEQAPVCSSFLPLLITVLTSSCACTLCYRLYQTSFPCQHDLLTILEGL